jgi:hypothetical protein
LPEIRAGIRRNGIFACSQRIIVVWQCAATQAAFSI